MANSNFVVNAAQFTPLSFDEYYKPLALLNEQHQKLDDAYLELYTKASTVEQMANEQTDPEAYKQYKAYADDLRSAIETLNRNGLTPNSRSQMLTMARRYGDEVAPIQGAYTRRAADITAQREALAKDQTIRFSRKASNSSLMDYMNNPSLSYESMSGAQITADVADRVKNLKGQILAGGIGPWSKTLGGQQFERMISTGLSAQDIYDIMSNPTKYPEFTALISEAVAASGVNEWGTAEDKAYAFQQAYKGLWEGIGTDKIESVENKDLDRAYKAVQIARIKDEMANPEKYGHKSTKSGSGEDDQLHGRHFNVQGRYTSQAERDRVKARDEDLKFLQKISESGKELKAKDQERLKQISETYGVKPAVKEDGTVDYTQLTNTVAALSGERYTPWYTSNLTDSSTLLSNIGYEISSSFNGEEISDKDMDLMFTTTRKRWKDINAGKSNGVERTKMDIMNDILQDKNSRITLDPLSGRLMVQQSVKPELGNIVLYDLGRDGAASRILGDQPFYMGVNGKTVRSSFTDLMKQINDLARYEHLYSGYEDYQPYYESLIETLFSGLASANNAVTMSHGNSSEKANTYVPIP